MKRFNIVFNVGLAIAALLLVSRNLTAMQFLLLVGIAHVIVLATVAWYTDRKFTAMVVEGLHKAGFLHTLMALGASLIASAQILGQQNLTAVQLRQVLAPMGAALIPHVLGVWSGQVLSSASFEAAPAIQETLFKTLAEDANTAREIIQRLFTDRERALREQIGSLQVQKRLLDDIHERNAKTAEQTLNTLTGLATSIRTAASQLSSSLEGLSTTVRAVSVSADEARTRIHSCADQVRECTGGIKEATDVVRDVAKLHDALSDLLKEKLFRASGA